MKPPIQNRAVAQKFATYPPNIRRRLLALRKLILATAAKTEGVGRIEETLKWGEPAYVTTETGAGSAVRIDWKRTRPAEFAVYFHCQTNLVENFRTLFPSEFRFDGNRALLLDEARPIPKDALEYCVASALTYHLRKPSPTAPVDARRNR